MIVKLKTILGIGLLCATSSVMAAKAILAGGCFWCMESDFEKLAGVSDVISGFTGGTVENPTYVIIPRGEIVWASVPTNYHRRAEVG